MPQAESVVIVENAGLGGISDYARLLSQALADAGCEVTLATTRDYPTRPSLCGVRVLRVFPRLRGKTRVERFLRRYGFARPLTAAMHIAVTLALLPTVRRAGIVHTQGAFEPPLTLFQHLLWRASGPALVHTPHNTFDRAGGRREAVRRRAERIADHVIVHARADLSNIEASLRYRTVVIPHGDYHSIAQAHTDTDREAARTRMNIPPAAPTALLYGQLRLDKGVDTLLEAACEVPDLWIIIAGEDKGALEAARIYLDDPRLAGRVIIRPGFHSVDATAQFFAASDFTVLPYSRASASGVLALSYGYERPAMVFPVGGLPEAVRAGETGWICLRPTAASLAATLRDAITQGSEEWERRGKMGFAYSQREFSWPSIAQRTISDAYEPARRRRGGTALHAENPQRHPS